MRLYSLVLASFLSFSLVGGAYAQQAQPAASEPAKTTPQPKKKKVEPKTASEILLNNARSVGLTGLEVTDAKGEVVGKLKNALAAGKKATLKLKKGTSCVVSVVANFEDEAAVEQTDLDLCKDKLVRFVD